MSACLRLICCLCLQVQTNYLYMTHTVLILTFSTSANMRSIPQQNTNNKIQFKTSFKILHVSAPECHPKAVFQSKRIQVQQANLGTDLPHYYYLFTFVIPLCQTQKQEEYIAVNTTIKCYVFNLAKRFDFIGSSSGQQYKIQKRSSFYVETNSTPDYYDLPVRILRNSQQFTMHRKPTFTDSNIPYDSFHHPDNRQTAIRFLLDQLSTHELNTSGKPLRTKLYLSNMKTQTLPHSKHSLPRL